MADLNGPRGQLPPADLTDLIPAEEWAVHRRVIDLAQRRGVPFAVGGGVAFSAYSGHWRNTKDIDLFVLPSEREAAIRCVRDAGLRDYYEREPYDRAWIYRGYEGSAIVDVIWQMANQRAAVDQAWLGRGEEIIVRGVRLTLLPPEELIWAKLYVMQRGRCDWPDLLNVLEVRGPGLDWEHLLRRTGEDRPLLAGLVSVFSWLCPARAGELPPWVWGRLGLAAPEAGPSCQEDRRQVMLLDTRHWFGPAGQED